MTDERLDMLDDELRGYEQQKRVLAMKMEELADIDCPLGVCVYDPRMQDLQSQMMHIQHRMDMVSDVMTILRQHGAA